MAAAADAHPSGRPSRAATLLATPARPAIPAPEVAVMSSGRVFGLRSRPPLSD